MKGSLSSKDSSRRKILPKTATVLGIKYSFLVTIQAFVGMRIIKKW
jgi:hypothetical protein